MVVLGFVPQALARGANLCERGARMCGAEEGGSLLGLDPEADADLLAEAPGLIPACVVGTDAFWKQRRGRSVAGGGWAKIPELGRDDPCPCCSGREHKRCCGAH